MEQSTKVNNDTVNQTVEDMNATKFTSADTRAVIQDQVTTQSSDNETTVQQMAVDKPAECKWTRPMLQAAM